MVAMRVGSEPAAAPDRRALVDRVHDAVVTAIVEQRIPPGHRINVESLARRLQVSATPVREALARLEADGLVQRELSKGWSTTPVLDQIELVELFELRELLEPWAASRAARCGEQEDHDALRAEMARVEDGVSTPGRGCGFVRHDRRFHGLLARIAGNAEVTEALERSRWHVHHIRLLRRHDALRPDVALDEHRHIVAAVVAGDEEGAAAAMLDHLRSSRERMLAMAIRTPVAPPLEAPL
jgi:DNA-binding GntR family transcriptional regulator